MDFEERLRQAVERGKRRHDEHAKEAAARAFTEEEIRQLHSRYRLQFSEYIEECLKKLPNHFPGFQIEPIYGEKGWGAAAFRDDLQISAGKRQNVYSRLELTIRPFSEFQVVDLAAKGTIANKEVFNRQHFEKVQETDAAAFEDLIDAWVLEYAELYALRQ